MRYIVNISFYGLTGTIVDKCKTVIEARAWGSEIDSTVRKALIKDTVTGNVEWLKNDDLIR